MRKLFLLIFMLLCMYCSGQYEGQWLIEADIDYIALDDDLEASDFSVVERSGILYMTSLFIKHTRVYLNLEHKTAIFASPFGTYVADLFDFGGSLRVQTILPYYGYVRLKLLKVNESTIEVSTTVPHLQQYFDYATSGVKLIRLGT